MNREATSNRGSFFIVTFYVLVYYINSTLIQGAIVCQFIEGYGKRKCR
ncbi:hypothetical protein SAMN05216179_1246 [Gracilibacillus kekensis]|uniref:Uncharacterized protein n=1 Tax=Gracilibacillus kekensis TaxID=1027249 RepID=A0A1M7MJQ3_9BACI|nr:hypothetical protein SAMN05216179_1246 [Gracilibacillus kekensis]